MIKAIADGLSKFSDWSASHGHLAFAVYFGAYGGVLQWYHKIDYNFILFMAAMQAFLLGHQIKDSYFNSLK